MTTLDIALAYAKAGLSVIPIRSDGTKAAACQWKRFQNHIPTTTEIRQMFRNGCGIAAVTGRVSGFLEVLDFETEAPFHAWFSLIEAHALRTAAGLVIVQTPSGGHHVVYRCSDGIQGNQKLAMLTPTKVLIETRGEGGYFLTVGSPAKCHPSGKQYTLLQGDLIPGGGEHAIPNLSAADRTLLLDAARSFNQSAKQTAINANPIPASSRERPGDLFNDRASWLDVLSPHGWKVAGQQGQETLWRRPGKDVGFSATTNFGGSDLLYVFSTSTVFEPERSYDKFGAMAVLEHGGDLGAAAKAIAVKYSLPASASRTKAAEATSSNGAEQSTDDDESPKPAPSLKNAVRAIIDHRLVDIRYDDFLCRAVTGNPSREWTDADDLELCIQLQSLRGFARIGLETVRNAALTIAFRNRSNCVRDWLESLTWDQKPRIERFLEECFGAASTSYTRSASANFWISMIARPYRPGCQSDHMLVLEGPQGIGKSAGLRIIGGDWFAEQDENVANYRAFTEVLRGKLLIEVSEMDSFSRAEVTRVKQIITCTVDRYRESYGRNAKDYPRQCIFVGTTNRDDWNRDETGARRFWPITCSSVNLPAIRATRDQLFAEAVHRFKAGQSWWEMPAEETLNEQQKRYVEDPWKSIIDEYIRTRGSVTVIEVLIDCLKFEKAKIQKADQMRVATCLRRLDWDKKKERLDGKPEWVWRLQS
jgi:hypothetical protein